MKKLPMLGYTRIIKLKDSSILNWLDRLSKLYEKYEQQPSTENLSLLLGYVSSTEFVKRHYKQLRD